MDARPDDDIGLRPDLFLREVADRDLDPVKLAGPLLGPGLDLWTGPTRNEPLGLINPLYATDCTEAGAVEQLRECGWVPPKETDSCSTRCRLNSLLIVDHVNRHGFHPYVYETAHHVRFGALGRDEAPAKLGGLEVAPATVRTPLTSRQPCAAYLECRNPPSRTDQYRVHNGESRTAHIHSHLARPHVGRCQQDAAPGSPGRHQKA